MGVTTMFLILVSIIAIGFFVGYAYWEWRHFKLVVKYNDLVQKYNSSERV